MKKTLILIVVVLLLLIASSSVFAGAQNSPVYLEWTWQGNKSGYFQTTGSGIVQMWSYDRPTGPDIHFVYKPLDKFPDASCDVGAVKVSADWKPINLYNVQDTATYKALFITIFPSFDTHYYLCGYPIE